MKHLFILMLFFIQSMFAFCQSKKTVEIETQTNGDTTFWYKWYSGRCESLKMSKTMNETLPFHFRFWQNGQVVDIWFGDNKIVEGQLINYIKKLNPKKNDSENPGDEKMISSRIKLDTSQARAVYNLVLSSGIQSIPTDEKIKGWAQGLDGTTYLMETSTPDAYRFKSYWTPSAQHGLPEAQLIQSFVDKINAQMELKGRYDKFVDTLPNGDYTNDGFGILKVSYR